MIFAESDPVPINKKSIAAAKTSCLLGGIKQDISL